MWIAGVCAGLGRGVRNVRFEVALAALAGLAASVKLWLAATTYGTNDVYAYERFATWSRYLGSELYAAAWDFNHPPSMMPVLMRLDALARATGVSFAFWLRLLPTLADAGTLWLIYRMLPVHDDPRVRGGLLLLAVSPVLVLVSGFHGNTDSIMTLLLVASVYWTDRTRRDGLAGAALGLAMCVKIVPVIAAPVLLLARRRWRDRSVFALAAGATLAVCWLPWLWPNARQVLSQVFGYRSLYGQWGVSWLLSRSFSPGELPAVALMRLGAPLLMVLAALVALVSFRRRSPPTTYAAVAVVFGLMLSLSNAFGVQYLAWLAPWLVGLPLSHVSLFSCAAGAFLLVVYNYWAGGWPWYLADSNVAGTFLGHLDVFHLLAWASVLCVCWSAMARASQGAALASPPEPAAPPVLRRGVAAATSLAVLALAAFQLHKGSSGQDEAAQRARLASVRSAQHVDLSSRLLRAGRPADGIAAARRALELVPSDAVAWNNVAAGHADKAEWDLSIDAARRALAINPDFTLARNNLSWAEAQKRQALAAGGS